MSIITGQCDNCEIELPGKDLYTDYDGVSRCLKCKLENDLYFARSEYKDKKLWLESTHLKYLKELKDEVQRIEQKLETINNAARSQTKTISE